MELEYAHPAPFWGEPNEGLVSLIIGSMILLTIVHCLIRADREELDTSAALCALGINGFVAWVTLANMNSPFLYWILTAIIVLGIIVPLSGQLYTHKLHRELDERFFEKCRIAIAFDPHNAGSHALLADACAHEGRHAEAVTHYEMALTLAPDPETNDQYDRWVRRLEAQRVAQRKCENVFPWWRLRI